MPSFTIRKWLVWTFVIGVLATTRAEYTVTSDRYTRCHQTEYEEYTVCELKILWITLHRMGWSETFKSNDWEDYQ